MKTRHLFFFSNFCPHTTTVIKAQNIKGDLNAFQKLVSFFFHFIKNYHKNQFVSQSPYYKVSKVSQLTNTPPTSTLISNNVTPATTSSNTAIRIN